MEVHVELAAETLFHLGPVPVTNSMLTMFIVMAVILLAGWLLARKASLVPGRSQGAFEGMVEFLLNLVEATAGKRAGRRIFPLVGALFIFIIFANYSGLLPGVGTVGFYETHAIEEGIQESGEEVTVPDADAVPDITQEEHEEDPSAVIGETEEIHAEDEHSEERVLVPYFRAPNADLNMTLAMALLTFTVVQVAGIAAHGVGGRIKHMADPPFLFPIEVISEFSRIISLSARLFGNVFAGEVLLAVMYALGAAIRVAIIPLAFPVVFLFAELLFGAIQALVFALLTLIYITLATAGGHDEAHHAHDEETHTEGAHGLGNIPAKANG
jgi:F-type H+-transporting ATPase subunit a